ncbi:MAG: hypothetical protein Q9160_001173 [Pyrenula sp. 1 TL-2023]
MAHSDSESSDTENEIGTRIKLSTKPASSAHRQRSLSESEVRSETSNYSDSQEGKASETDENTDEGIDDEHTEEHNGYALATSETHTSDTMHGFAKTPARRPKPNSSSSDSGSETSSDHEEGHETLGGKVAQERAYPTNYSEQASESENTDTNFVPKSRSRKFTHKARDVRVKTPLRQSENGSSSPEVSEVGEPEDPDYEEPDEVDTEESKEADHPGPQAIKGAESEHSDSQESEEATSETFNSGPRSNTIWPMKVIDGGDLLPRQRELDTQKTLSKKRRRRSHSRETSDKASQVLARKRRQLSSTDEPHPIVPVANTAHDDEHVRMPETQSKWHSNQSKSQRARNQANLDVPRAETERLSLQYDNNSGDDGADNGELLQAVDRISSNTSKIAKDRGKSRARPKSSEASTPNKTGRFSDSEIRSVERFKEGWCVEFQIDEQTFNECINHRRKAPFPSGLGFIKKHMLDEFLSVLPHRDKRSMFRYKERNWQNVTEKPHEWNDDQDRELERLISRHGTKWTLIASRLGRSQDDAAQRWRNYVAKRATKKAGLWSTPEIEKLRSAVATALQNAGDGSTIDHISWDNVSEIMGGSRTAQQCSGKWHKLMVNDEKSHWYKENQIIAPEGYRVQLVKVQKDYKRQKPRKPTGPTSVNPQRDVEREQSETYIQRAPEDSEGENDLMSEPSSKESDISKPASQSPEPRQHRAHSSGKESLTPRKPRSSMLDSTQTGPTEYTNTLDSTRKHINSSTPVSKEQCRDFAAPGPPPRPFLRKTDVNKKPHFDPKASRSPQKNQDLRLGDAFSATSPATRPESTQSLSMREERPSPRITIQKAPARKPGRSDLSQVITDTVDPYEGASIEKGDVNRENLDRHLGGNQESEDNSGLPDDDAQEVDRSIDDREFQIEQASEDEVDALRPNSVVTKQEDPFRDSTRQSEERESNGLAATNNQKLPGSQEPRLKAKRTRHKNEMLSSNPPPNPTTPQDKSNTGSSGPQMRKPPSYEDIMRSEGGKSASDNSLALGNREKGLAGDHSETPRLEQEKDSDTIDDTGARLLNGKASKRPRKKGKGRVHRP